MKTGTLTALTATWGEKFASNLFFDHMINKNLTNLSSYPEELMKVIRNMLHNIAPKKGSNPILDDGAFFAEFLATIKLCEKVVRQNMMNVSDIAVLRSKISLLNPALRQFEGISDSIQEIKRPLAEIQRLIQKMETSRIANREMIPEYLTSRWTRNELEPLPSIDNYMFFSRKEFRALVDELKLAYNQSPHKFQGYFGAICIKILNNVNSPMRYLAKALKDKTIIEQHFGADLGGEMMRIYNILENGSAGARAELYEAAAGAEEDESFNQFRLKVGCVEVVATSDVFDDVQNFSSLIQDSVREGNQVILAQQDRQLQMLEEEGRARGIEPE